MRVNRIRELYKKGTVSTGTITHLKSLPAVEAIGGCGFDYIVIDQEHCAVDDDAMTQYLIAASAARITPVVRVSEASRSPILRALDAGAMGVIVPCLETVGDVKEMISYAKFSPVGDRGYCPTRDGLWGRSEDYAGGLMDYMSIANRDTMLLPQCETLGVLENIEAITALEGVDGIMVGPFDMSIAMGIPGQFEDPEFKKAMARIVAACKAAHIPSINFCSDTNAAKTAMEAGFDSILLGLDIGVMIAGYKSMLADLQH